MVFDFLSSLSSQEAGNFNIGSMCATAAVPAPRGTYLAQWDFYVGQPKTKYQIFTCFSKFCLFISNQTYS